MNTVYIQSIRAIYHHHFIYFFFIFFFRESGGKGLFWHNWMNCVDCRERKLERRVR